MGNTPSNASTTESTYDSYIRQQQDLIIQQQQQINHLYQMNLEQQQTNQQMRQNQNPYEQVPPNILAEQGYDERFQNLPHNYLIWNLTLQ